MRLDKIDQFSDMFLAPSNSVIQNTISDKPSNKSTKNSSFKKELDNKIYHNETKEKTESSNRTTDNYPDKSSKRTKNLNSEEGHTKEQAPELKKENKQPGNRSDNKGNDENIVIKKDIPTKQKSSLKHTIEEIKDDIKKNEFIKNQIKEKITDTKLTTPQKTDTKKSAEELLFQQLDSKNRTSEKKETKTSNETGTAIENKFKNIKDKLENNIEQKKETTSKVEQNITPKEKVIIQNNDQIKEDSIPPNFNLNLEKEISSTEIKLEKTGNHKHILEQYQEISDKILNKVDNVIKYMASKGGDSITIKLQPPELGKIQVELVMKDNALNAKINTENIAVKEVILTNLDQLKASIENNGFNINKLEVEIGGFKNFLPNESQNPKNKNKNGSKKQTSTVRAFSIGTEVINKPLNTYTFMVGRSVNMLAQKFLSNLKKKHHAVSIC